MFAGDICDVPAEALCTSTNPRLSLAMGTGGSVRGRGGYEILRECEAIVDAAAARGLPAGSAHQTSAGELAAKMIIHCVASDAGHRSSPGIIRDCVKNALALADAAGCETIAMPLFGTGHARFKFDDAVRVMAETIRDQATDVRRVFIVIFDDERVDDAMRIVRSVFPNAEVDLQRGPASEETSSMWGAEW
ncbi:MAG: macro domain-containing protein [Acidobacteria bacterium]|nr:macro domain-containing protein [Acidobacteriota bacterium]MBV9068794.1 macro domain-containing protein [Acidobacteriota bacterium]MBV9187981.1 macro domain-containing protein [Acidobacteriota bacterium]